MTEIPLTRRAEALDNLRPMMLSNDPAIRENAWLQYRDFLCPDYDKFAGRAPEFLKRLGNHLAEHGCNRSHEGVLRVLADMNLDAPAIAQQFDAAGLSCSCVIYKSLLSVTHTTDFDIHQPAQN